MEKLFNQRQKTNLNELKNDKPNYGYAKEQNDEKLMG